MSDGPQIAPLNVDPAVLKAFVQGQPPGAITPPPPVTSAPPEVQASINRLRASLPVAPAHATADDPIKIAVALLKDARVDAKRQTLDEIRLELPEVLEKLAARRYAIWILLAALALLGFGFGLGLLYSSAGMVCDSVSSPGWRHCYQLIGVPHGVVAGR